MKYANSILVRQLSEANKGAKVEISASTEEVHTRRLPLAMATWPSTLMFSPLQYSPTSSVCAELTDTSAVSALVSSGSKSYCLISHLRNVHTGQWRIQRGVAGVATHH